MLRLYVAHFRMKAHISVDAETGLTHTVVGTAANVNDVTQAQALLSGEETVVYADAGYQGVEKREENLELPVTWQVAMKPSKRKALPKTPVGELSERIEHLKASVRAKVEHPFHVVKTCSIITRRATGASIKTPSSGSPCLAWPIWCWRAVGCWPLDSQVAP